VPEGKNHLGPLPPTLTFAHVPEGKTVKKNRLHLDVNPTDREQAEEVRRLLDLGARHADVGQGDQSWVVLADPEGSIPIYVRGLGLATAQNCWALAA
jgi:Glyoxalase-like domain